MRAIHLFVALGALVLCQQIDAFVPVNPIVHTSGHSRTPSPTSAAFPALSSTKSSGKRPPSGASLEGKVLEPQVQTVSQVTADKRGGVLASVALLNSSRLIRLSAIAWILGEFFSWIGLFDENASISVLGDNLKEKVRDLRWTAEELWATARCPGGALNMTTWKESGVPDTVSSKLYGLSLKHRFAVGAGVGLLCSQAALGVAKRVFKTCALLYAVSEVTNLIVDDQPQHSYRKTSLWINATEVVNKKLTGLRLAVRKAIQSPRGVLVKIQSWFQETETGRRPVLPRDTLRGLAVGIVASFLL